MKKQAHHFDAAPDPRALRSYLRFSYPAETEDLFGEAERSFSMPRFSADPTMTKDEYLEKLHGILERVFQVERKESDAAFLSSGVDSSLVAFGIGAKKTFSVAYEDDAFDESELARRAADMLGSEHHVLKISPSDFFGAVGEAMRWRRVPTGDASYIALFLAAREASRFTDVICSGEGPDEQFCGYPCYSRYFESPEEDYWLRVNSVMDIGGIPELPNYGGDGFLKMNAFDLTFWMHGNILPNVYRAAEGAGITIRTPYMDPKLTEFALSLPVEYKVNGTMGKLLFREAAQCYVGSEIAWREKRGFPVPVRKWMRSEPYRTQIMDALCGSTAEKLLSCVPVREIAEAFYSSEDDALWKQIWEMFVLIKWYESSGDGINEDDR